MEWNYNVAFVTCPADHSYSNLIFKGWPGFDCRHCRWIFPHSEGILSRKNFAAGLVLFFWILYSFCVSFLLESVAKEGENIDKVALLRNGLYPVEVHPSLCWSEVVERKTRDAEKQIHILWNESFRAVSAAAIAMQALPKCPSIKLLTSTRSFQFSFSYEMPMQGNETPWRVFLCDSGPIGVSELIKNPRYIQEMISPLQIKEFGPEGRASSQNCILFRQQTPLTTLVVGKKGDVLGTQLAFSLQQEKHDPDFFIFVDQETKQILRGKAERNLKCF